MGAASSTRKKRQAEAANAAAAAAVASATAQRGGVQSSAAPAAGGQQQGTVQRVERIERGRRRSSLVAAGAMEGVDGANVDVPALIRQQAAAERETAATQGGGLGRQYRPTILVKPDRAGSPVPSSESPVPPTDVTRSPSEVAAAVEGAAPAPAPTAAAAAAAPSTAAAGETGGAATHAATERPVGVLSPAGGSGKDRSHKSFKFDDAEHTVGYTRCVAKGEEKRRLFYTKVEIGQMMTEWMNELDEEAGLFAVQSARVEGRAIVYGVKWGDKPNGAVEWVTRDVLYNTAPSLLSEYESVHAHEIYAMSGELKALLGQPQAATSSG
eukprot:g5682.t1